MTDEYDKLVQTIISSRVGYTAHPNDERRFKEFLAFAKISNREKMTPTTFRGAFEEARGNNAITEQSELDKIDKLYERYEKAKDK